MLINIHIMDDENLRIITKLSNANTQLTKHDRDSSKYIKHKRRLVSHQVTPVGHSVTQSVTLSKQSLSQLENKTVIFGAKFLVIV